MGAAADGCSMPDLPECEGKSPKNFASLQSLRNTRKQGRALHERVILVDKTDRLYMSIVMPTTVKHAS